MMPGDVYEVIVRHGHQKWRSKGKLGLNSQCWENNVFVFKALVGDILSIKVSLNMSPTHHLPFVPKIIRLVTVTIC